MSETTTPSIGAIAAGLVTAASSEIVPVQKVEAAVEHGADVFLQHNEALAPVLEGAEQTVSALASTHGLGVVWEILETIFPFLAGSHHAAPVVPSSTASTPSPG